MTRSFLMVKERRVPLALRRHPRARRYILRLAPDGSALVTIPRSGSVAEAQSFAERNIGWLESALNRRSTLPTPPREWLVGMEILFRGDLVRIEATADGGNGVVKFGPDSIHAPSPNGDVRRYLEGHLWRMSAREFPGRVFELAAAHGLQVRRVTVRNQRSRWGSCSRRATISLNWRLIQTPPFVRDYLILHELMHLKEMNHSDRFWKHVSRVCPDYRSAEKWLNQHAFLLRS